MAKITIKQILLSNRNWWNFYQKYKGKIRPGIVECIVKLLACKDIVRGYRQYICSNPKCSHTKKQPFTCKCKACSSCGKKEIEKWITKQNQLLPDTQWQHITFTMPCELWDLFWCNRFLLNHIAKCAAESVKKFGAKNNIILGIFIAIHTFGRDLKRNVHIHLSTTVGGLTLDYSQWKTLTFHQITLMKMWKHNVIALFREHQDQLVLPEKLKQQLNNAFTLDDFFDQQYRRTWNVFCGDITDDFKYNVSYLGRYAKRPPIAESKLKHYDGHSVVFNYLDHRTKTYRRFKLSHEQFIAKFIRHIPDKHFRVIRYYGFLSNRLRGQLLPIVYRFLNQKICNIQIPLTFAELIRENFGHDPLKCVLCGSQMLPSLVHYGKSSSELMFFHRELALMKKI